MADEAEPIHHAEEPEGGQKYNPFFVAPQVVTHHSYQTLTQTLYGVWYLLHKDCQLSLFTSRAGENLSFLFVSIHLQAGESDLFSMVEPHLQARISKCLCSLVSSYSTPG